MTREEIVKALRACSNDTSCSKCTLWDSSLDLYCMDYAMTCAADMLEQDAPGWISVKDRLPEPNERVLAYFPKMRDSEAVMLPSKGWAVNKYVSHWMPLPEPPKEETK